MRGITFGTPFFETELGRVEPDSEIHFAVALYAASSDPDVGVPRDELASILWPDSTLDAGRHNLRQAMYRLRQLGVPVHLKVGQVMLSDTDTEIDLRELVHGPVVRDDLLRIATQEFLPGYAPRLGPRYAAWLQDLRDRTDRVRRHALVEAVRDARAQARFRDIHKLAPALLALDPLNETATLALAEALVMDGSKVEALRMLEQYEHEVGSISEALRVPVRTLRRRVSECLDDALLPRRFEVPFVGRETEFRVLRDGFVAMRMGKAQCFVISGEAGIGKTRIAQELLRLAVLDGAMVVTYACTSGDTVSPLSSLFALLEGLLGQPGALGCGSEHLQYLRRIRGSEAITPGAPSIGGDIAYAQLVYSLSELVAAVADEGPLVLFLDDAHRLSQTSWRLLSDVANRLPDNRLLLLFAARHLPAWYGALGIASSDGRIRHVMLAPFSQTVSESFVSLWSEKNSTTTSELECERVAQAAAGNPFYLGELLTHLDRGGRASDAPASIKDLVQLQYLSLSKAAQRGLLVAALMQWHSTTARVSSVLRLPPSEFLSLLDELESSGLIVAEGSRVRLRHDLIGDIALGIAPATVQQYLRMRIAARLEREGRRTGSIELLSDAFAHWDRASSPERAFSVGVALGERSLAAGLSSDGARALERTLACATTPDQNALAARLLCRALCAASEWEKICILFEGEGQPGLWSPTLKHEPEMQLTLVEARLWSRSIRPPSGMLESIFLDDSKDDSVRIRAATLAVIANDNDLVVDSYMERHGAVLQSLALGSAATENRLLLQLILATCTGASIEASTLATRYAAEVRERSPGDRVRALRQLAHAMQRVGQTEDALELFAASLADARRLRLPDHQVHSLAELCTLSLQMGDVSAARAYSTQFRALAETGNNVSIFAYGLCQVEAELAFLEQDFALAESALRRLRALSETAEMAALQQYLVVARATLSFAFPTLLDQHTVQSCRSLPSSVMKRGGFDIAAVATARAFAIVGDAQGAVTFLSNYFEHLRIEKYPLCGSIAERLPAEVRSALPFLAEIS